MPGTKKDSYLSDMISYNKKNTGQSSAFCPVTNKFAHVVTKFAREQ